MVQSLILTGPTAVGKSRLAIEIAQKLNLEIINADSVCFYREFNIGSAKPSAVELKSVPHHLIDVVNPDETYHAGQFIKDVETSISEIHSRGKRALIVGGSGFYLKALRFGLWEAPPTSDRLRAELATKSTAELFSALTAKDSEHAQKIGAVDRYRILRSLEIIELSGKKPSELQAQMRTEPDPKFPLWVVDRQTDELAARIEARVEEMLRSGWIEEVKTIRQNYPLAKTLTAIGYAQIINHLNGVLPAGRKLRPGTLGLKDEIILAHRQLAKSQRTWFKGMKPNENFHLNDAYALLIEKVMSFYQ